MAPSIQLAMYQDRHEKRAGPLRESYQKHACRISDLCEMLP
jgi:hypothetical protein